MKRIASIVLAVFVCVCLMVATEKRAYAYVDPGSGLMVIQSAASVLVAVGYFFRRKIGAISGALFGGAKPAEAVTGTAAPAPVSAKRASRRLA